MVGQLGSRHWLVVCTYRDGQVVAASQLSDLASVPERCTHDNGIVAVLLVVVVDALDGLDTGVLLGGIFALVGGLEPVKDAADERRDEEGTGLGTGDGLNQREHQGQVAVDLVLRLEDVSGLDALPGGSDLDQDAVAGNADRLVHLAGLVVCLPDWVTGEAVLRYLDDVQGLVDGDLGIVGETGIDLSRHLSGDDLENLLAELDEETVEGGVDLLVEGLALLLAVLDGGIDQRGIFGLLGGGQNQGRVGGGILRLVLADS